MDRTPLYEKSFRNLIESSESTSRQIMRQLEIPQAAQVARVLGRNDIAKLMTSVQQAKIPFDSYATSPHWMEFSALIEAMRRAVAGWETVVAIQRFDQDRRNLVLAASRAVLPAAEDLRAVTENAARAIQPIYDQFAEFGRWQSSIAERMATLTTPWAMKSHLGVSVTGFSRIARLHDISTGGAPFAPETVKIFEEELGRPIPFDETVEPEARESKAMDAGLNPELIAFPKQAYPNVLFSAGFEFKVETIGNIQSEQGDDSGVFDPQHASLFQLIENHLRKVIESELRDLAGQRWHQFRVPNPTCQRWQTRKEKDEQERGDSFSLIFYADFTDLSEIICRKDNWNDTFQRRFVSKEDIQTSLRRLNPIRNAIAHSRPLVRTDQIVLNSEAFRILNALGVRI